MSNSGFNFTDAFAGAVKEVGLAILAVVYVPYLIMGFFSVGIIGIFAPGAVAMFEEGYCRTAACDAVFFFAALIPAVVYWLAGWKLGKRLGIGGKTGLWYAVLITLPPLLLCIAVIGDH